MYLKIKRLHPDAEIPIRAYNGDLGFDLFALETVVIQPGQTVTAKTGVACSFPEGWGAFIKPRSSQGKASIDIFGGVVDNGYRGEIGVLLHNAIQSDTDVETVIYRKGEKIGQLVLVQVFPGQVVEVQELDDTTRGNKGFGSTGR